MEIVQLSQVVGLSCGILTKVAHLREMVEQGGSTVLCYSKGVVEALQSFPILYTMHDTMVGESVCSVRPVFQCFLFVSSNALVPVGRL